MTHSWRFSTIPVMRCSPQAGHQRTPADRFEGGGPDVGLRVVQAHEPLDRGAEDDGLLAPPAVRILVPEVLVEVEEGPGRPKVLHDPGIGVEHLRAAVLRGGRETPRFVHGGEDRKVLAASGREVILSVAGRRVHEARPRVHRDVRAGDEPERARLLFGSQLAAHLRSKGMPVSQAGERGSFCRAEDGELLPPSEAATAARSFCATR